MLLLFTFQFIFRPRLCLFGASFLDDGHQSESFPQFERISALSLCFMPVLCCLGKGDLWDRRAGFSSTKKRLEFQGHRLRDSNAPQRSLFGSFKASRMLDRLVFGNTIRTRLEIGFPFSWRQRGYRPGRINQHVGRKKKSRFLPSNNRTSLRATR